MFAVLDLCQESARLNSFPKYKRVSLYLSLGCLEVKIVTKTRRKGAGNLGPAAGPAGKLQSLESSDGGGEPFSFWPTLE